MGDKLRVAGSLDPVLTHNIKPLERAPVPKKPRTPSLGLALPGDKSREDDSYLAVTRQTNRAPVTRGNESSQCGHWGRSLGAVAAAPSRRPAAPCVAEDAPARLLQGPSRGRLSIRRPLPPSESPPPRARGRSAGDPSPSPPHSYTARALGRVKSSRRPASSPAGGPRSPGGLLPPQPPPPPTAPPRRPPRPAQRRRAPR